MRLCGIYQIKNKINNMVYIGSSIDIERRWKEHVRELRSKQHHNSNLQKDWHEYGEENFIFDIIQTVDDENKLIDAEQYYIDLTKCYDINNGYNICATAGNCLGVKRTEEEKRWLSKVISGEKNSRAKISDQDAINICKRIICGESVKSIANDYPLSASAISSIKGGNSWTHVSIDYIDRFPKKIKLTDNEKKIKQVKYYEQKKIKQVQNEEVVVEQVTNLYLQFISNTAKRLNVTELFIRKNIYEYEEIESNKSEIDENKLDIIRKKGKENNKNSKQEYLFSGLIKCLECSKNYRGKMNRKTVIYICSGYSKDKSNCARFAIKEKDILNVIAIHFKSNTVDLNLIKSIDIVESKFAKINYTDGTHSIYSPQ